MSLLWFFGSKFSRSAPRIHDRSSLSRRHIAGFVIYKSLPLSVWASTKFLLWIAIWSKSPETFIFALTNTPAVKLCFIPIAEIVSKFYNPFIAHPFYLYRATTERGWLCNAWEGMPRPWQRFPLDLLRTRNHCSCSQAWWRLRWSPLWKVTDRNS